MARNKAEKQKAKRKAKKKERRKTQSAILKKDKADFFLYEAGWYLDNGQHDKALVYLKKALQLDPHNQDMLEDLFRLGFEMQRNDIQLIALKRLYDSGQLRDEFLPVLPDLLARDGQFEATLEVSQELLARLSSIKIPNKKSLRARILSMEDYCRARIESDRALRALQSEAERPAAPPRATEPTDRVSKPVSAAPALEISTIPDIPVSITVDAASFQKPFSNGNFTHFGRYELAIAAHRMRFRDSFEKLICLPDLRGVRSLWYQEETARKVLKIFRGRALLSDEVGLGKTIEAGMVLKEYIQRGMVKTALILTPSSLVSQWQDELRSKFDLDLPSTDDPAFRKNSRQFWQAPFILASINQAKSKRNFQKVSQREYDIVIVDEAHHLKNRNTLNWKLVNALKKRFLLLLTATPVENNLMELYNLITLLKPGQLKTASAFRQEFMVRGDPTDPQNRSQLKSLLGQVMIRNTRALAKLNIPPRMAQTIRVDSGTTEKTLYERVTALVKQINAVNGAGHKLLLKTLLAEAGSSPRAVVLTLSRLLAKKDFLLDHENEIRALRNLCRSMGDTRKDKVLLKLIRSNPGKKIIFVKYLATVEHLSDFLGWHEIPCALYHGGLNSASKDEQIRIFREERDVLVTTEIGGEGRNLQFCHQMVNYDLPWNPMKIEQRIGRIHRIGQEKEVNVYNLCAADTVEDYILEVLDRKINMFEMVIGEIDMILGRIRKEKEFSDFVYDIWLQSSSEQERKKEFEQLAVQLKRYKASYEKTKVLDDKLFGENYEL